MRDKFEPVHSSSIFEYDNYGCPISFMKAQAAVEELCRYFLGDNWYDDSGTTNVEQINTNIVLEIEQNYRGIKTGWFKRRKLDTKHIWNICNSKGWKDYILSPPMKAQVAIHELCRYFLGDNWYDNSGATHPERVNARIVCEIKKRYKGYKYNKRR